MILPERKLVKNKRFPLQWNAYFMVTYVKERKRKGDAKVPAKSNGQGSAGELGLAGLIFKPVALLVKTISQDSRHFFFNFI